MSCEMGIARNTEDELAKANCEKSERCENRNCIYLMRSLTSISPHLSTSHLFSHLATRNSDLCNSPSSRDPLLLNSPQLSTLTSRVALRASRVACICHDLPKFQLAETKVLDRLPDPSPIIAGAPAPRSSDGI